MKKADGLFLESCQEAAKQFPQIGYEEVIVDNCMMQMVSKPQQFDVMVRACARAVWWPDRVPSASVDVSQRLPPTLPPLLSTHPFLPPSSPCR